MTQSVKVKHTIYLVRHGEAMGNVRRVLLPPEEDILSQDGWKQVNLLGEHLADVQFSKIYCSDYSRALETAKTIRDVSHFRIMPHNFTPTPKLRERNYGSCIGFTYKEVFQYFRDSDVSSIFDLEAEGAETYEACTDRMFGLFDGLCTELEPRPEPETILLVSHSFAITALLKRLSSSSGSFTMLGWNPQVDLKVMSNASYMRISLEFAPHDQPDHQDQIDPIPENNNNNNNLRSRKRVLTFVDVHVNSHLKSMEQSSSTGSFVKFIKSTNTPEVQQFNGCVHQ